MLPEPANLQPILEQLQMLEEYGWELEEDVEELSKQVAIVAKENELQSIQIEEVKTLNSNPLGGLVFGSETYHQQKYMLKNNIYMIMKKVTENL